MGLNMYELLPFWHTFFTRLNFEVVVSPRSDRKLYLSGQQTIPSDTVCFPAKADARSRRGAARRGSRRDILSLHDLQLRRGSRRQPLQLSGRRLLSRGHRREYAGARRRKIHQGLHRSTHRPKDFAKHIYTILSKYFDGLDPKEVALACKAAYAERDKFLAEVRDEGKKYIAEARRRGLPIIVLAGRPYQRRPRDQPTEIDRLVCDCGAVVVTEDSVSDEVMKFPTGVLNQWTYHSRLYAAARYIAGQDDMNLVQLVSFGCGVDAITTDEVREILERGGQDIHADQDRRNHKPWRGQDKTAQPLLGVRSQEARTD